MATVTLRYAFADGDSIGVSVEVADSYPDAVDEARANAVRAFRESVGDVVAAITANSDDDDE